MTRTVLSALLGHWRRHPLQLLTLVLGLALATALWSAVQAINAEARSSYDRAAVALEQAARPVVSRPAGLLTLDDFAKLRRAGWPVTPLLEGRLTLDTGPVQLLGVDLLSWRGTVLLDPTLDVSPVDLLTPPGRLLARQELAARLAGAPNLPPVVVADVAPAGIVLTDISTAERLLQRQGQIDRFELLGPVPETSAPLAALLPGARLEPAEAADAASLTASFHLNLTAFGLLSFAVGLFVIHGVSGLAFEERRSTFRTLRALGVPLRLLMRLVLAELVALALLAGTIGVGIGYVIAAALLPDVSASLRGLYGAGIGDALHLRPGWVPGAMGMALVGALTAGAQGLFRLQRLPILAATGPDRWTACARRQFRRMAVVGVAIALSGLAALGLDELLAGFAAVAGLLLGAALCLPTLLQFAINVAVKRARTPISQWVWADMAVQLPSLSLALMALLLALATNIGVGTMVSSFRLTFTGWLDQRLFAELYLRAQTDTQAAGITEWLTPRVDAVLPIRATNAPIAGQSGRIFGIVDHASYRENWPLVAASPDAWDQLQNGAVLVNEQAAYRADLRIGDSISLGSGWAATIAGIYSDYGNPRAQALVAMPNLLKHHPGVPGRQMGLRIDRSRTPELIADLRRAFDLPADAITNQRQIKDASLRIFERTFLVTGALNVLTLGVAGFAILTSLLTLWSARLPQIAPVWALGLGRARLARLEVLRSCGLAALTALISLPVGLALAWLLLAVVNVQAFGWRLPMFLFPRDWLFLFGLAIVAGALAALIPARRLVRTPPAALLKVFADEG